jgi:hypothetical protein
LIPNGFVQTTPSRVRRNDPTLCMQLRMTTGTQKLGVETLSISPVANVMKLEQLTRPASFATIGGTDERRTTNGWSELRRIRNSLDFALRRKIPTLRGRYPTSEEDYPGRESWVPWNLPKK